MAKLNLCIPTMNKVDIVVENLEKMNEYLILNDIDVYVYDDSNNEELEIRLKELCTQKKWNNIHYAKNKLPNGHDNNISNSIFSTPGDYVYLLGESIVISKKGIENLKSSINESDYDAIIVNDSDNKVDKFYTDINDFYSDYGWYVTFTGSTIYSRKLIQKVKENNLHEKYMNLLYIQWAILFEGLNQKKINVKFISENVLTAHKKKGVSFALKSYFEIFCFNWCKLNELLPDEYSAESRKKVIGDLDLHLMYLSSISRLVFMRGNGFIRRKDYLKYKTYVDACVSKPNFKLMFILHCPIIFPKFACLVYNKLKK